MVNRLRTLDCKIHELEAGSGDNELDIQAAELEVKVLLIEMMEEN